MIFEAFNACPFEAVKVVVLGQDPYHGPGQAHGLCFSVPEGVGHPIFVNIFKEIEHDIGCATRKAEISPLGKTGCFFTNATLSVRAQGRKSSKTRMGAIYRSCNSNAVKEKEGVVLLWGGYAKKKAQLIDSSNI